MHINAHIGDGDDEDNDNASRLIVTSGRMMGKGKMIRRKKKNKTKISNSGQCSQLLKHCHPPSSLSFPLISSAKLINQINHSLA